MGQFFLFKKLHFYSSEIQKTLVEFGVVDLGTEVYLMVLHMYGQMSSSSINSIILKCMEQHVKMGL